MMESLKDQFLWDLRGKPFFSLEEPNGERVDVAASFAGVSKQDPPTYKKKLIALYRVLVCGLFISVLIQDLMGRPLTLWNYFGYLTNMALVFSIAYLLISSVCTLFSDKLCGQPRGSSRPNIFILLAWVLYSLAAPLQLQQTLLYWVLLHVYHWYIDYIAIMKHGILPLLVIMDGAFVGKVPIRFMHFAFFFAVFLFYTIWSIIHSLKGKGDGYFDWSVNSTQSTMFAFIAVFVFAPAVCGLLWILSRIGGRRLYNSATKAVPFAHSYARDESAHGSYHASA